jgi:hypothetical protein
MQYRFLTGSQNGALPVMRAFHGTGESLTQPLSFALRRFISNSGGDSLATIEAADNELVKSDGERDRLSPSMFVCCRLADLQTRRVSVACFSLLQPYAAGFLDSFSGFPAQDAIMIRTNLGPDPRRLPTGPGGASN